MITFKIDLWTFFKSLYSELNTLFPDPYTSIGGDEAWILPWACSNKIQEWINEKKLIDINGAAKWYQKEIFNIVNSFSKRTMMWTPGQGIPDSSTIHLIWSGWVGKGFLLFYYFILYLFFNSCFLLLLTCS